jgi:hypothetical protein
MILSTKEYVPMFYELIFTRCKQGMNIQQGQKVSSEGYKEYAYSPELAQDGVVDLSLLADSMRKPQSFKDPEFMEDAYIYSVPDIGYPFVLNFHPIAWDRNFDTKGKFSNRPGNFINHVYVGDFTETYIYNFFGD